MGFLVENFMNEIKIGTFGHAKFKYMALGMQFGFDGYGRVTGFNGKITFKDNDGFDKFKIIPETFCFTEAKEPEIVKL